MHRRAGLALIVLLPGIAGSPAAAQTATPIDGRIVRVVYKVVFENQGPRNATWGFHLAHMSDGRYCVRFGDPGRLALANIRRTNDICFDTIPGKVARSSERTAPSLDAREKGRTINVTTFQRGSIAVAGQNVTLDIETCAKIEGEAETRCFPNRYVVYMGGENCTAEITLASSSSRVGATTCEHYEAE